MESRTQRSRPRTQKNFEAKAKNRPSRGQGPRTQAQVFSKKKGLQKFFSGDLKNKGLKNFFQAKRSSKIFFRRSPLEENKKGLRKFSARFLALSNQILTVQKIVMSSSRGQGNFRWLEASRPRPRTWKCVLEDSSSEYHLQYFCTSYAQLSDIISPYSAQQSHGSWLCLQEPWVAYQILNRCDSRGEVYYSFCNVRITVEHLVFVAHPHQKAHYRYRNS